MDTQLDTPVAPPRPYTLTDARHLGANREGRLTQEQSRLLRSILWRRRSTGLVGGMLLCPVASLFVAGLFVRLDTGDVDTALAAFVACAAGSFAWWTGGQLLPFVRLLRDCSERRVHSIAGRVRWRRGRYGIATTAESGRPRALEYIRPCGAARGTIEGPLPGPCRAHFLRHSNIVVSAEPSAATGLRPTAELAETLLHVAGISGPEIAQCRAGDLPPAGRRRLRRMLGARLGGILLLSAYLIADWSRLAEEPMWLGVVMVAVGFAVAYLLSRVRALWRDMHGARVDHVCSALDKVYKSATASAVWPERFLVLPSPAGGMSLPVPKPIFTAVKSALEYRVYFTPSAPVVIAIEPVDNFI